MLFARRGDEWIYERANVPERTPPRGVVFSDRGLYRPGETATFRGVVREVKVEGLLAQVELDVTDPVRVVAIITRDAVEELGLKPGVSAAGVVKATSVMVEL